MKIIKRGTVIKTEENRTALKTCSNCKSELEYIKSDIKYGYRDLDYIVCPVCGQFLTVSHSDFYNPLKS